MKQLHAQEVITSTVSVKKFLTVLTDKLKELLDHILYRPSANIAFPAEFEIMSSSKVWCRVGSDVRRQ
jgi:hypothetical protein